MIECIVGCQPYLYANSKCPNAHSFCVDTIIRPTTESTLSRTNNPLRSQDDSRCNTYLRLCRVRRFNQLHPISLVQSLIRSLS